MKKFIALFLMVSLLGINCATIKPTRKEKEWASKKRKHGAELLIQKTDGAQIIGELITVKQSSLLLLERESGVDVIVDIGDVSEIILVKKSKSVPGVGFGLLFGGAFGATIGFLQGDDRPGFFSSSAEEKAGFYALGLGIIGAVLGGLAGAFAGEDETILVEGRSDSEIQEILEKLREKARVRNFQ